jgi:hypothetical protein
MQYAILTLTVTLQSQKLGVAPITGDELEKRVNAFALPADMKTKNRRVLYE